MFLGDFEGGALLLEDGRRFEKRGVWHRYDGRALLHWNEDITAGTKYSVIVHNNEARPLVYPYKKAGQKVKEEDAAPDSEAGAGQRGQEAQGL